MSARDRAEQEALENRYRLITAEAALDKRVQLFIDQLVVKWRAEVGKLSRQGPLGAAELDRRLTTLRYTLDEITQVEFEALRKFVKETARQVYVTESYRARSIFQNVAFEARGTLTPVFGGVSRQQLAASFVSDPTRLFSQTMEKALNSIRDELAKDVAQTLADGWRVDRLAKLWTNKLGAAGVARRHAVAAARTAVMEASNNAAYASYRESDVVVGMRWEATFDTRTCLRCAGYHGRVWLVNEAAPGMPAHLNCRCTWLPVLAGDKLKRDTSARFFDVKTRKFVKPKNAGLRFAQSDRAFDKWLRKAGKEAQADFFPSKKKLDLWKSGVPLESLVSPGGSILPDSLLPKAIKTGRR